MLNSKRTGKQNGIEVHTHITYFTLEDTESRRHVGLQRDGITFFIFYFILFYYYYFFLHLFCIIFNFDLMPRLHLECL